MDSDAIRYWKKPLCLAEILDALENLPDDIPLPSDVYLEPPDFHSDTEEDSGEEEDNDPNSFTKNQLLAGVELNFDDNEQDEENCHELIVDVSTNLAQKRITQKWKEGNEDDLRLAAFFYQHKKWEGTKSCPLSLSAESDPIDFFKLFVPPTFVESIVINTVNYAATKRNKIINIEPDDFYAFYGVMILSGYNTVPRRRLYWAMDDDVRNVLITKWMRRNTFEDIFVNIHFCDNDLIDKDTRDRFAKIRPCINHFNELFLKYAPIGMNISIDEAMVPYYGKHPCKQFIRNKPVRFGYKAWVAASPSGYCYLFDVYQGRNQERDMTLGLGESIVVDFAKKIKGRFQDLSFSFFFDNFFTGPNLINTLTGMQCAGTGTLRVNRLKNIQMIDKKQMNKKARGFYESHVDQRNELILIKWKDNKIVSLLSNAFGIHPLATARRYVHSERKKTNIPQPQVVAHYNKFMGGVDLLDRHISNYRISIQGKKFYMPIILWMLDLAVSNAWSLAKTYNCQIDQLEFRRRLARALLIRHGKIQTKGKSTKQPEYLSKGAHTSVKAESRLRCKQCHSHTHYRCDICNIALHTKCSSIFHKNLK